MNTVLLQGIVGSTAYGLAGPQSDVDRLGVYAAPTRAFHGLHLPIDRHASVVSHEPSGHRPAHPQARTCCASCTRAKPCTPPAS